ncbi:MAG: PilZ domain-containing protein [Cyanobacteriota bacterium]|nr:PilZ domain-containing protein [Cyanobacteriota bacterium]
MAFAPPPPPPPPPLGAASRRRFTRLQVPAGPAIGLCGLAADGAWAPCAMPADILDISLGGLCLLIHDRQAFQPGDRLLLLVDSQPGFGVGQLTGSIRWMRCSGLAGVCVTGVAFDRPLTVLPRLS